MKIGICQAYTVHFYRKFVKTFVEPKKYRDFFNFGIEILYRE